MGTFGTKNAKTAVAAKRFEVPSAYAVVKCNKSNDIMTFWLKSSLFFSTTRLCLDNALNADVPVGNSVLRRGCVQRNRWERRYTRRVL